MAHTPQHIPDDIVLPLDSVMLLPSIEEGQHLRRVGRLTAVAAAVALAASGCSVGDPDAIPEPKDTRPNLSVTADRVAGADAGIAAVSYELDLAIKAGQLTDYVEIQDEKRADYLDKSAPIFSVVRGTDGKLKVVDQTDGKVDMAIQQPLIEAVAQNEPLLDGIMAPEGVHAVRMRMAAPDPSEYDSSTPFYLPNDGSDTERAGRVGGRDNIYEVLDPEKQETIDDVALLLGHEGMHAALKQGERANPMTPEQRKRLNNACLEIRKSVSQDIRDSAIEYEMMLQDLSYYAKPDTLKAINKVIAAIEDGTYYKLPMSLNQDDSTIAGCEIPNPIWAVNNVMRASYKNKPGIKLDKLPDYEQDSIYTQMDKWLPYLKANTIYGALSESSYLTVPDDDDLRGHPNDNADELLASTLNVALNHAEAMAEKLKSATPKDRAAIDQIVTVGLESMRSKFGKHPRLMKWLDEREALYRKHVTLAA